MDTPLEPQEIRRHLAGLTSRQKRALTKAGFRARALASLAVFPNGAPMVEAVLACHTDVLGRAPRPQEAELAEAARHRLNARRESGSPILPGWDFASSERSQLHVVPEYRAEVDAILKTKEEADQKAKEADQ